MLKVENPQENIIDLLIAQLIQNIFLQIHIPRTTHTVTDLSRLSSIKW